MLLITGASLYIVAPSLIATFGSLPQLGGVFPAWFALIGLLEALAFVCIWELIRVALDTDRWFDVATSQLAGNAVSHALPGGAATGGALQIRLLTRAGFPFTTTTTALTAVGLLSTATLFVLPLLALPAMLFGLAVGSELLRGAILAAVLGAFLLGGGSLLLTSDGIIRAIGRLLDWVLHRVRPKRVPSGSLADRLLESRNLVRRSLSASWKLALPASFGNQLFDYLALETSLLAVGAHVNPILVLLAFVAASALAMIPFTPGGLGFVEAGLAAVLALAGVDAAHAVLATLLYRLFSYWLPMPAGLLASILFGRRHPAGAAPATGAT
jgi:putative heme transporter